MNWQLFGSAFATIFLAELGDKTQLATFGISAAGGGGRASVFLGASLALVLATGLAVLLGDAVGRYVPELWIRRSAGALFIALGLWFVLGRPTT